jgi:hypothetical protein
MSPRAAAWLAWSLWTLCVALAVLAVLLALYTLPFLGETAGVGVTARVLAYSWRCRC